MQNTAPGENPAAEAAPETPAPALLPARHITDISQIDLMGAAASGTRTPAPEVFRLIPTRSPHKRSATRTINRLVFEEPEMMATVCVLISYPTQKWAMTARKEMGIENSTKFTSDLEGMFGTVVKELNEIREVAGIVPMLSESDYTYCIDKSDRLLDLADEAFEWLKEMPSSGEKMYRALSEVHSFSGEPVSNYEFSRYYVPALKAVHFRYGGQFRELVDDLCTIPWWSDAEYRKAYHNAKTMVRIYPAMKHLYAGNEDIAYEWDDRKIQRHSDGLMLLRRIEHAAAMVREYPDGGESMYAVLSAYMEGCSIEETKKKAGMSYEKSQYTGRRAINLMGILLWGYSTERVIGCILKER